MNKQQARDSLLEKILEELRAHGHLLSSFEEGYWNALRSGSEDALMEMVTSKENAERAAATDKLFSDALSAVMQREVQSDPAAAARYTQLVRAVEQDICLGGICFDGATRVLPAPKPRPSWPVFVFLVAFVLLFAAVWYWASHQH